MSKITTSRVAKQARGGGVRHLKAEATAFDSGVTGERWWLDLLSRETLERLEAHEEREKLGEADGV